LNGNDIRWADKYGLSVCQRVASIGKLISCGSFAPQTLLKNSTQSYRPSCDGLGFMSPNDGVSFLEWYKDNLENLLRKHIGQDRTTRH
jgi:hypothetical protein